MPVTTTRLRLLMAMENEVNPSYPEKYCILDFTLNTVIMFLPHPIKTLFTKNLSYSQVASCASTQKLSRCQCRINAAPGDN